MRFVRSAYANLLSVFLRSVGVALIIYSTLQQLTASPAAAAVPEIDASSITAGLGLLAGVTLIFSARRNRP